MKVLLIAPYQGLAELAKQMNLSTEDIQIDIDIGDLETGVKIAKAKEVNYDAIISRGGTAQLIQEAVTIPVAHIKINGYDMLRVLKLVNNYEEQVALVGFSNITKGAVTLCDILDYDVKINTIHNQQEVHDKLIHLREEGYKFILGDVVTVKVAQQLGLKGILISSGKEALIDALAESKRLYSNYIKVKQQVTLIERLYREIPTQLAIYHVKQGILHHYSDRRLAQLIIEYDLESKLKHVADTRQAKIIEIPIKQEGTYIKVLPLEQNIVGLIRIHHISEDKYPFITIKHNILPTPIIGVSEHSKQIQSSIHRLAKNYKTVSLIGEYGTGKMLVAKHIHVEMSQQAELLYIIDILKIKNEKKFRDFIEHFGTNIKGTIILKNIAYISSEIETLLISFLKQLKEHVKVITITSSDLSKFVKQYNMSETLASLLSEETLHLFSLQERLEDIPSLVQYYLAHFYMTKGMQTIGVKEDALSILYTHPWRDNVKELRQLMKELSLLSQGHYITKDDVQNLLFQYEEQEVYENNEAPTILIHGTLKEMEKKIIQKVLKEENQNQTKAAARLAINRTTLWRKLNDS